MQTKIKLEKTLKNLKYNLRVIKFLKYLSEEYPSINISRLFKYYIEMISDSKEWTKSLEAMIDKHEDNKHINNDKLFFKGGY